MKRDFNRPSEIWTLQRKSLPHSTRCDITVCFRDDLIRCIGLEQKAHTIPVGSHQFRSFSSPRHQTSRESDKQEWLRLSCQVELRAPFRNGSRHAVRVSSVLELLQEAQNCNRVTTRNDMPSPLDMNLSPRVGHVPGYILVVTL